MHRDTLHVRFSDGLVGWRLALTKSRQDWKGIATYLTDVVVAGAQPTQHPVVLERRLCSVEDARERVVQDPSVPASDR
jgi:hypothetical protein